MYQNGIEHVCRKEMINKFGRFLKAGEGQVFKGRLQLRHSGTMVDILVKGEIVGQLPAATISLQLENPEIIKPDL